MATRVVKVEPFDLVVFGDTAPERPRIVSTTK